VRLDFDPARPIYLQIVDEIRRAVARGELAPGDRIPSLRELAQHAGVNPNTVQRAFQEMERMRLTETLRGQGTFICGDPDLVARLRAEMARDALGAFLREMFSLGYTADDIRRLLDAALNEQTKRGDAGAE
jgi:GntR family transcriptional regulator